MKFTRAIDLFIVDMRAYKRINSNETETAYRHCLGAHCDDVANRDPTLTGRDDVKRTLRRWENANTQRNRRSILISFYDWMVEEGMRPYNPARQTHRPKKQATDEYRLTLDETRALMLACTDDREEAGIYLGCCAGLRNKELRGMQGRHLRRDGFVWVSKDIGKGNRERWIPVIPDLVPVVARLSLADDEFVLPAQRWRDPGRNKQRVDLSLVKSSAQGLYYLVKRVADRIGLEDQVHPHTMRHAFADHIARCAGVQIAQVLLGHADLGTTQLYLGKPTLDALSDAVSGASYGLSPENGPFSSGPVVSGREPVVPSSRSVERNGADHAV